MRNFFKPATGLVASVLLVLIGTSSTLRADDSADVKTAAKAFGSAVEQRDIDKMRAAATADSGKVVDGFAAMLNACKKLDDLTESKFQQKISPAGQSSEKYRNLDNAAVVVTGDMATLTAASAPGTPAVRPIIMKREGTDWKVDIIAGVHDATKVIKMFEIYASSADATTGEINDGKYTSANDAQTGYYKHVSDGVRDAGLATRSN